MYVCLCTCIVYAQVCCMCYVCMCACTIMCVRREKEKIMSSHSHIIVYNPNYTTSGSRWHPFEEPRHCRPQLSCSLITTYTTMSFLNGDFLPLFVEMQVPRPVQPMEPTSQVTVAPAHRPRVSMFLHNIL